MIYPDFLKLIKQDVLLWNGWREVNPTLPLDLTEADLSQQNLNHCNLANVNLFRANLQGANLDGANLAQANLQEADLCHASLREALLTEANLRKARFINANLWSADLCHAVLIEANLNEACCQNAKFIGAHLEAALLNKANLCKAKLQEAFLQRANLSEACLRQARLMNSHLGGAILAKANLGQARLDEADLAGADLHEAYLEEARFIKAELKEARLVDTHLPKAKLIEANLEGADLSRAILSGADLTKANLRGAQLTGAYLEDAVLAFADLREASLAGARIHRANLHGARLEGLRCDGTQPLPGELERRLALRPEPQPTVTPDGLQLTIWEFHPRLLAKRHLSPIHFRIELRINQEKVLIRLARIHDYLNETAVVELCHQELAKGIPVSLELSGIDMEPKEPIPSELKNGQLIAADYLIKPTDSCSSGEHTLSLSVTDTRTGQPLPPHRFNVPIAGLMFGHISQPGLLVLSFRFLIISSLAFCLATLLGVVGVGLGVAFSAIAILSAAYLRWRFVNCFIRIRPNPACAASIPKDPLLKKILRFRSAVPTSNNDLTCKIKP